MNKTSVFSSHDYRDYLKSWLSAQRPQRGKMTELAQWAGCQRSYLSRVLHGHVQLTPDHAFGLCEYWRFSPTETRHFLMLVESARAASSSYRKHLATQLEQVRQQRENLAITLKRERLANAHEHIYYSAWYWGAIHVLVSIPEFQTVGKIATRLQLPEALVESTLKQLEQFRLVKRMASRWVFASADLHLPKDSPSIAQHHQNWRTRAVLDAQLPESDGLHCSVAQTMSESAYRQLKEKLLHFIEEQKAIAGPSKEEELVCVNLDCFRV